MIYWRYSKDILMPIESEKKVENIDGIEKDKLVLTFSNGALEQLVDLKKHFKLTDDTDVVKFGISMLQKFKESDEKEKKVQSE